MNKAVMNCGNGNGVFDVFFPDFSSFFADEFEKRLMHDGAWRVSGKVDVRENETEYIVESDLPGMSEEDIDISIKDGLLTLSCKKSKGYEKINEELDMERRNEEEKKEVYLIKERSNVEFKRTFSFANRIDEDGITASFENGVLEVRIPKKEEKSFRKIKLSCQKTIEN